MLRRAWNRNNVAKMVEVLTDNLIEAMEMAPEAVVLWDADGRLVMCNDKYRDLFQHFAEIIRPGLNIEELLNRIKASGLRIVEEGEPADWHEAELALRDRNYLPDVVTQYDGKWFQISRKKLSDGSIIAFHTDITNVKKSEERFRKVFLSSPALVSISTVDTATIFDVNDVWLKTLGYERHEVIGKTPFELNLLVDPEIRSKAAGSLVQDRHANVQTQYVTKSGEIRDFLVSGERIEFEGYDCYLFISQDITEKRNQERELELAKSQAEAANKAKSNFLTHMSHELRTPLNSILGFSQLISNDKKHKIDDANSRRIQIILKSGQHLLHLIEELLDLSSVEAGKISVNLNPIGPANALSEAVAGLEAQAGEKNISIAVDPQVHSLPSVQVDEVRLKQVFLNLLSNAIKYNRDGGEVDVVFQILESSKLRIEIRDTGIGINSDRLVSIFEPFNRPWTISPQISGSGIGLSITKQLVDLMGGSVGVTSEEGIGSTFWVDLNIVEDISVDDEIQNAPFKTDQFSIGLSDGNTKQILYIDDDASSIELMQDIFEDIDFVELVTSSDAECGLQIAEEVAPDLIIMDINLPAMSGSKLLEKLKENEPTKNIPAIAVSADALPEHIKNGLEQGFVSYLTKPIILSELHTAVEKFIK
tara:strand:+ start:1851 stop:3794 length:1944 start_codon:yes stop_codon:yes gene_type:complete